MRHTNEFMPQQSVYPSNGLDTRDPGTLTDPSYTPDVLNMTFKKGMPAKRRGYSQLGSDLDGTVMAIVKFEVGAGVIKTVAITTTKEYVLDGDDWVNITKQLTGADQNRTGTELDLIDHTVGTDVSGTWLIITNGKDLPRKWNGSDSNFIDSGIDLPGFMSCKTLEIFESSLLLGNLNDDEEKTIAWSDTNNFFSFLIGNADAQNMNDGDGPIQRLLILADRLVVYHQNSIGLVTYVGGTVVYQTEQLIQETRLLSGRSIVNVGPYHLFAAQENVYAFTGTRQLQPIGDMVQSKYREDLTIDSAKYCLMFWDSIETQVMVHIPVSATEGIMYIFELNLNNTEDIKVTRLDFNDNTNCIGYLRRDENLLWNSSRIDSFSWDDAAWNWYDNISKAGYPMVVFGAGSKVLLYDGATYGDNGQSVSSHLDTIDFTVPQEYTSSYGRWLEIEIELRGSDIEVLYSIDQGSNFVPVLTGETVSNDGTFQLTTKFSRYRFFVDIVSQTFRVRLKNNSASGWFERRALRVWVIQSGAD
jgi:hypothetical protein